MSLVLVLTADGGAQLEEDGDPVWFSDDDEDFMEEYKDEFLDENCFEDVINYLVDKGMIDEDEKEDVVCEVETADGTGDDEDDDEDEDTD